MDELEPLRLMSEASFGSYLSGQLGVDLQNCPPGAALSDLGLDSLDIGELVWWIEDLFAGHQVLDVEELHPSSTLADCYRLYLRGASTIRRNGS